ncbi:hypothetical protein L218DRAFT_987092 [Marasmius fiardii PR-910]|nr:hypothetical protein L218DRAFT_987092 [Marasmius fiardii PR-910]
MLFQSSFLRTAFDTNQWSFVGKLKCIGEQKTNNVDGKSPGPGPNAAVELSIPIHWKIISNSFAYCLKQRLFLSYQTSGSPPPGTPAIPRSIKKRSNQSLSKKGLQFYTGTKLCQRGKAESVDSLRWLEHKSVSPELSNEILQVFWSNQFILQVKGIRNSALHPKREAPQNQESVAGKAPNNWICQKPPTFIENSSARRISVPLALSRSSVAVEESSGRACKECLMQFLLTLALKAVLLPNGAFDLRNLYHEVQKQHSTIYPGLIH